MTELAVDPARLTFIDVCTSSHNHTDHLDAETLNPLRQANPGMKFIIPGGESRVCGGAAGLRSRWPIGMNDGESITAGAFHITAVPAAHEQVERMNRALQVSRLCRQIRPVDGLSCRATRCCMTAWSATCVRFGSMSRYCRSMAPRPNGASREISMRKEAAWLGKQIGAKLVIPMHYDMFDFNTAPVEEFAEAARPEGVRYQILQCGERWSSERLRRNGVA